MVPDASDSPSDESFTVLTQRVCAGRFPRASFELMSQTYKVKSSDPAANKLPSGEIATELTLSVKTSVGCSRSFSFDIPGSGSFVPRTLC